MKLIFLTQTPRLSLRPPWERAFLDRLNKYAPIIGHDYTHRISPIKFEQPIKLLVITPPCSNSGDASDTLKLKVTNKNYPHYRAEERT